VRTPENWEAYDLYLRGRYYWNKFSEDGMQKAIGTFSKAIDKDPNYALAYAGWRMPTMNFIVILLAR